MIPLGNMVKIMGGFAFKSKEFIDRGIPIVRISNIIDGNVDVSIDPVCYTKASLDQYKDYQLHDGDILIAMSGATTGKIGIVKREQTPSLLNQRVGKFIIKDNSLLKEYLYWVVRSSYYQNALWNYAAGCAQPNVSSKQLESIEIPVPPLPTQRKIASILEKTESAKEKRKEADRLTNEFLKSVFLEMFGNPIRNPMKWKIDRIVVSVEEIENENPEIYPEKNYDYIDISSIDNILKKITQIKKIYGKTAPSRARQVVKDNDILVSTVRPNLNAVAIVPDNLDNPIASTGFCVLRVNKDLMSPSYLFEICKTPFFIASLTKIAKGASYPAVTDNDVKSLRIPIPPLALQQKFTDLVQKVEKLKEKQQESEKEIDNLFNSLMQKAFI